MASELVPYSDIQRMAKAVVKGGLFPGIKTAEQALTLFMVAQAEGLHPMTAMMRYNIIQGRPAMKAEAMLASFMERGGTVDWTEYTDDAVTGVFTSHGVPNGVTVRWTMAEARRASLTGNQTWTKYPKQMLKARVASDGVRMADPAVNQGRYTPEEVSEFEPVPKVAQAEVVVHRASAEATEPFKAASDSPPNVVMDGQDLTPVLEESIKAAKTKKGAGRSSREASGRTEPVAPNAPDAVAPQPAPVSTPEVVNGAMAEEGPPPEVCYCGAPIGLFFSTQERYIGRPYLQCAASHQEIEDRLNDGWSTRDAHASVSTCYRAWAGKWPLGEPTA